MQRHACSQLGRAVVVGAWVLPSPQQHALHPRHPCKVADCSTNHSICHDLCVIPQVHQIGYLLDELKWKIAHPPQCLRVKSLNQGPPSDAVVTDVCHSCCVCFLLVIDIYPLCIMIFVVFNHFHCLSN